MNKTKICSRCKIELPLTNEYFNKNPNHKNGLESCCKECSKKLSRQYKLENKDKIKQYYEENKKEIISRNKKYFEKNKEKINEHRIIYQNSNKEKLKEAHKQTYLRNRESILLKKKEYYKQNIKRIKEYREINKESIAKTSKLYHENHKEQNYVHTQKRRSLKKQLPSTLTIEQWEKVKQYFDNKCCYCGRKLYLEQEHFVPLTLNGEYTLNNILPACRKCNGSKHNKLFKDWYPTYAYYDSNREKTILKFLNYKNNIQQLTLAI